MLYRRRPVTRGDFPPRDGEWFAEPRPVRRTTGKLPGWWVLPAVPYFLYLTIDALSGGTAPSWAGLGALAAGLLWLVLEVRWRVGEALALRMLRSDRAFSDGAPGLVEYPVEIVLDNDGESIGADRGFVWFENGLLNFNGTACSFALSAADFFPWEKIGEKDPYYGIPGGALRLRMSGRPTTVRFLPLGGYRRWGFHYRLGFFLGKGETNDAPRQWPPLRPYGPVPKSSEHPLGTPEVTDVVRSRP